MLTNICCANCPALLSVNLYAALSNAPLPLPPVPLKAESVFIKKLPIVCVSSHALAVALYTSNFPKFVL